MRLGEVATYIGGITFKPTDLVEVGAPDSVVCMRTKNVQELLDTEDLIAVPRSFVKRSEQMLREGDILVSSANSWNLVGKCCFVPRLPYDAAIGGFISLLRPAPERVEPAYLYRWLAWDTTQQQVRQLARQTTNIANLPRERFLDLDVPLPPLVEQRRIADLLDEADALRRKRRESLALLDDLLRATFVDMFGDPVTNPRGWPTKTLADVLTFLTSGSRGWAQYYSETGAVFIRIQNVGRNRMLDDDLVFVNPPVGAEADRTRTQANDVLLSITADLGRTAVVPPHLAGAHINQHLAILRVRGIEPSFLSAFLASAGGQLQISRLNREGVKAGLNFDDVRSIKVLLPPLPLQERYGTVERTIVAELTRAREALVQAEGLFAALLDRTFSDA